jgi:molybdate transport system substrate-binding protein
VEALVAQARNDLGHELKVQFNTAPQIAKRLADNEIHDVLISPPAVISQAAKDGKVLPDTRVAIGRVGAGIVVRNGTVLPRIDNVDAFKQALLAADSLVYNNASTGIYLDQLFVRLGIAGQLKDKTTRYANGAMVMEHLIKGRGNEIGFGAITEIRMYESRGLKLAGPLPAEVQNYTGYEAALMTGAPSVNAAKDLLRYLATPTAKALFAARGIE